MALASKTKVINDVTYRVAQLPARKAVVLFAKVAKTLGPLAKGLKNVNQEDLKNSELSNNLELLGSICENLNADNLAELLVAVLLSGSVWKDGVEVKNIDVSFPDDPLVMLQVVAMFLEANFKNFITGLGTLRTAFSGQSVETKTASP